MISAITATIAEMFQYTFLQRAFVVGALVSVCAALLGLGLVLKRYSMIGDGLSHVGFGALALAGALNLAPLSVAIPLVIAAAFLLLRLGEKHLIKGDAAIALISTSSLALGVVVISRTTGMNTDVCNYLFGSILAMNRYDVYLSVALSAVVLLVFALFYHKLFAVTFDESFAAAAGVNTRFYNMLIAFLTAITIVLGMRMMGAMLISALIIFPALTSMRVFKTFKSVSVSAVCVSAGCFFAGIVVSYQYAMPAGASVVLMNIGCFALFWLVSALKARAPFRLSALAAVFCAVLLASGCRNGKAGAIAFGSAERQDVPAFSGAAEAGGAGAGQETPPGKAASAAARKGGVVEIKEKMFLAQTNDIYLNPDEYLGKTIKLEGLFKEEAYQDRRYCFVLRYGPGCCGSDGNAGFEVAWEGEGGGRFPRQDDWVAASGVLKQYNEDGFPYIYIALSELNALEKRGAEFVTQ